jgi:hypothetical protein
VVPKKTAKEFKVRDVTSAEYSSYQPQSGDVFRVIKF